MLIYLGENNITRIKFKRNKFLVKHDRIENRMLIVKKKTGHSVINREHFFFRFMTLLLCFISVLVRRH